MLRIRRAETKDDLNQVRELFNEYMHLVCDMLDEELGIRFDVQSKVDQDMTELEQFSPPDGCMLLAMDGSDVAGIACMRRVGDGVGEIKRMYVRPSFRRKGIGRELLRCLIEEATRIGYRTIRLDSFRTMKEALALYTSSGFREIAAYPETEIPLELHEHWIFMEKVLWRTGREKNPQTAEPPARGAGSLR